MKTIVDAAMAPHYKKTKPGNKCNRFKNENGKKGNNNATMHKRKDRNAVNPMSITYHISCEHFETNK
jgi:hypothetical protein